MVAINDQPRIPHWTQLAGETIGQQWFRYAEERFAGALMDYVSRMDHAWAKPVSENIHSLLTSAARITGTCHMDALANRTTTDTEAIRCYNAIIAAIQRTADNHERFGYYEIDTVNKVGDVTVTPDKVFGQQRLAIVADRIDAENFGLTLITAFTEALTTTQIGSGDVGGTQRLPCLIQSVAATDVIYAMHYTCTPKTDATGMCEITRDGFGTSLAEFLDRNVRTPEWTSTPDVERRMRIALHAFSIT